MKIKSHKSNWAMALCAAAVFSFIATQGAQAGLRKVVSPDPFIQPPSPIVTDVQRASITPTPLPPIAPAVEQGSVVKSGTFTGTVVTD
jgi:hypothetical protein